MRRLIRLLSILLAANWGSAVQGGEFDSLLRRVPPQANALVLIDVEATLAAKLPQQQGWGKKLEAAYVERPIFLPPEATRLVLAASLDPDAEFQRRWELAVMQVAPMPPMSMVARNEGGYLDEIAGVSAAWTPSNAYFLAMADDELGVAYPADRQFAARWIDYARTSQQPQLSPYLLSATQSLNEKIQILIALDLAHVAKPHQIDQRIKESPQFDQAKISSEVATPIIASLQGAMMRVAITDKAHAELRIDFERDVTPLKSIIKEVALEALGEAGLNAGEMESWKSSVQSNRLTLQGTLNQDGLRRILSVVELPTAKFSMLKDEQASNDADADSLARESSIVYFRSVGALLKDLQQDLRGNKASAAVMERYAGRIDRMPILNVDPELLNYGQNVAVILRSVALSKRQGGIAAGVSTAGMGGGGYASYNYEYVGYGGGDDLYAGARASAADRTRIKAEALAESNNARVEGAKLIADATAEIRRQMTQKYQVEF